MLQWRLCPHLRNIKVLRKIRLTLRHATMWARTSLPLHFFRIGLLLILLQPAYCRSDRITSATTSLTPLRYGAVKGINVGRLTLGSFGHVSILIIGGLINGVDRVRKSSELLPWRHWRRPIGRLLPFRLTFKFLVLFAEFIFAQLEGRHILFHVDLLLLLLLLQMLELVSLETPVGPFFFHGYAQLAAFGFGFFHPFFDFGQAGPEGGLFFL